MPGCWPGPSQRLGYQMFDFDPAADLVMGHELSARVLELGEGVTGLPAGTEVVAHPMARAGERVHSVGFSNDFPGGYAERLVVEAERRPAHPRGHRSPTGRPDRAPRGRPARRQRLRPAPPSGAAPSWWAAARWASPSPPRGQTGRCPPRRGLGPLAHPPGPRPACSAPTWWWTRERRTPSSSGARTVAGAAPCCSRLWGYPVASPALMAVAPPRSQIVVVGVCMEPDRDRPARRHHETAQPSTSPWAGPPPSSPPP